MTPEVLDAILRSDFRAFMQKVFHETTPDREFSPAWHLDLLANVLAGVASGARRRQIIEVPPRSLKSISSSVALVAWLLGHDPTHKIICVSYSQSLADLLSAQCRQVMMSEWYQRMFPATRIDPRKNTESYFRTTAGGSRYATSVGGTLTGRGSDLIIIDDPIKTDDAHSEATREQVLRWFDQTLSSRLDDKRSGRILIVMQRVHVDDLAGHVRDRPGWQALTIPAIAVEDEIHDLGNGRVHRRRAGELIDPLREPREVLDELKLSLGSRAFAAQYQQDPLPDDGGVVDWNWFKRWTAVPERGRAHIVQSWDCASKDSEFADYSVCTTWAILGDSYLLLDLYRRRLSYPELRAAVMAQAERHGPQEILIEDAAAGIGLLQELRLLRPIRMPLPTPIKADRDKVTRLHLVSAAIEQGRVSIPLEAEWLEDLRREILQFPHGKHDDQVDSISQFLNYAETRRMRGSRVQVVSMFGGEARRRNR